MVRVITRTSPDGESFEPANKIKILDSGALEIRNSEENHEETVAAYAPGEWTKATVETETRTA